MTDNTENNIAQPDVQNEEVKEIEVSTPTENHKATSESVEIEPEVTEETSIDDLPLPGDEKKEEKKEAKNWIDRRIAKKEKEIAQKSAEAEAYRAELERIKSLPQQVMNVENDFPQRENFDTEAEYISAAVHHVNTASYKKMMAEQQEVNKIEAEKQFLKKWNNSEEEGLKKYDDFDQKMDILNSDEIPGNRAMAEAVVESPHKTDILYFLGTYKDHAIKIAKMPPTQAIKEIAKLEVRFAQQKKTNVKASPKILEPVKSNKSAGSEGDPETMSQAEYNAWYASRKKKKA